MGSGVLGLGSFYFAGWPTYQLLFKMEGMMDFGEWYGPMSGLRVYSRGMTQR